VIEDVNKRLSCLDTLTRHRHEHDTTRHGHGHGHYRNTVEYTARIYSGYASSSDLRMVAYSSKSRRST